MTRHRGSSLRGHASGPMMAREQGEKTVSKEKTVELLKSGIAGWNKWREENPDEKIDLRGANLCYANLCYADLRDANLRGADLCKTILDPKNKANANVDEFEIDGEFIVGYRTKQSQNCGNKTYIASRVYSAPVFSVCITECHPGLYLSPSFKWLQQNGYQEPYVKVWARAEDTHRAGDKYRTRGFHRVEDMEA